jgi:hypothetical protein
VMLNPDVDEKRVGLGRLETLRHRPVRDVHGRARPVIDLKPE